MGGPEGRIGINETKYFGNTKITAIAEPKKTVIAGETAEHEATHAVTAIKNGTSVRMATNIAGDGYLGATFLSRPDAVAAAAPHAVGHRGTGHDVSIVHAIGNHGAFSAARTIVAMNHDNISAVAALIEEKGTVSGGEIEATMDAVDKKEEKVTIVVEDITAGKRKQEKVIASKGVVVFKSEWLGNHISSEKKAA